MRDRISKSRAHVSRPKASQQQQLDTVVSTGAEPPPTNAPRTPARVHLAPDSSSLRPRKRQFDGISGNDPSPAKRPRLTQTGATGHLRRSARLRERRHFAGSEDPIPIAPSTPFYELQVETGARNVPPALKRVGRPLANTQQFGVENEEVEQAIQSGQQRKPFKRRHTTPPEPKVERQENIPPITRSQKRQIGSDENDEQHHLKRARLTRENLAVFNKMGRKKGTKASASSESTVESTKTTSTTTSGFAIQARKNGILNPLNSKPPTNLEDIRKRYARSRETASPPESVYKRYARTVSKAYNEATMVVEVSGDMLKKYDDDGYHRAFNQSFTGFPKDVGFNNGLSVPQPDFVEGLEMEEYHPFPVDEHVSGSVLYKDDPYSLTLPHLAGEWKGRGKDMEEARLQSAYDGAALVYGRNQALSYIGKSDPPGHAEITTFTTDGTNLNFYAHYATQSEGGALEYHQYQYASANVKDSHQGHKDGRRGLRNEQDHARKQSYDLRDQLKVRWKQHRGALRGIAEDTAMVQQDEGLSPNEFVDCEEYPASQDVYGAPYHQQSFADAGDDAASQDADDLGYLYPEDDQQDESQASALFEGASASFTTSFTSSFNTNDTRSKRPRASHSPPARAHRPRKHGSAMNGTSDKATGPGHEDRGIDKHERRERRSVRVRKCKG